jgi:hypothetical protein
MDPHCDVFRLCAAILMRHARPRLSARLPIAQLQAKRNHPLVGAQRSADAPGD